VITSTRSPKTLLEYETLDGSQIKELIKHGELINPPPSVTADIGRKNAARKTAAPGRSRSRAPPLPGALGGAPA